MILQVFFILSEKMKCTLCQIFKYSCYNFNSDSSITKNRMMKKAIFIILLALLSSCATNTSFNSFYQNNQQDSDFSLGLNSSLISSFLSDEDYADIKPILKKAKHIRILVFEENQHEKSQKFDKFLKHSKFEKLIQIKDDKDAVNIFALEKKEKIKEIVLEINDGDELILLGLKTNLTHKDLENLDI